MLTLRKILHQVVKAVEKVGGKSVDMDCKPCEAANEMLNDSTFVLERLTMFPGGWLEKNKQFWHPVARQGFESKIARPSTCTAVDISKDLHKQVVYKRTVESIMRIVGAERGSISEGAAEITLMIVPTPPFHPTIEEVEKDLVTINSRLGAFAHCANVLDLVGVVLPCGIYEVGEVVDGRRGALPFGVTSRAGAGLDAELLTVGSGLEEVS
ncbi:hypothetical protein PZA11_001254 [Diplocarpon coronariae]